MPVLFIPNTTSEKKEKTDVLDAALEPSVQDCLLSFVDGIDVDYSYPVGMIDGTTNLNSRFTMRCMLVMFTGDHPAQCKFAGFSTGGFSGCRRCIVPSRWRETPGVGVGGVTEYINSRRSYRQSNVTRDMVSLQEAATKLSACETISQRKEITKSSGVVHKTRAWRLFKTLGLDLSQDCTFDVMHVLALCLFKKFIALLKKETADHPEWKEAVTRAMAEVQKKKPSSIAGRIRFEEGIGPNSAILEHVAGYNKVKTNSRNMEATFTSHYTRLFYGKCLLQRWEDDDGLMPAERSLALVHRHLTSHPSSETGCFPSHADGVVVVTSLKAAKEMWQKIISENFPERSCGTKIQEQGIGIATKRCRLSDVTRTMKIYLTRYWRERLSVPSDPLVDFQTKFSTLKSVLVRGTIFKPGDHVVVLDERRDDISYDWNWKAVVVRLIRHSCAGRTEMFVECSWSYYNTSSTVQRGETIVNQQVDCFSGMQLLASSVRSHGSDD
ncbi:hypothetical protein R1sor_019326 [Riccia sorocarpa]|uniref:DUF5641 domain-containing protein n=1 Tax=Riccia sorocarpa TaxID=122646 RepID=A0ABD3IDX5_9MARC